MQEMNLTVTLPLLLVASGTFVSVQATYFIFQGSRSECAKTCQCPIEDAPIQRLDSGSLEARPSDRRFSTQA